MEIALLCKDFNIPLGISIDETSNSVIIPKPDHMVKNANSFMEIIGSKVRFYLAQGEIDNHKYAKRFIEDYQFPISDIPEDGDATFFLHDSLHHILGFGLTKPYIMERARQNLKISLDFKKYASETRQISNRPDLVEFISSPEFKYAVNGLIDSLIGVIDKNSFNAARESWDAIRVTEEWFNGHDQIPLSKLSIGEILSAPEKANAKKISFQYLFNNLKYIEGVMGYTFGMIIPGLPKLIPGKITLSRETLAKLHSCLKDNYYVVTMLSAVLDDIPLTTEEVSMYEMLARDFWKANSQKYPSVDTHDLVFDGDDLIQAYLESFSSHLHAVEILQKLSQKDVKSLLDGQKKFAVTCSKI